MRERLISQIKVTIENWDEMFEGLDSLPLEDLERIGEWIRRELIELDCTHAEDECETCIRRRYERYEKDRHCKDCDVHTMEIGEYYMVQDHIWEDAHPDLPGGTGRWWWLAWGMLCIGCLEARIGRRLCAADFTDYPINYLEDPTKSERLLGRLLGL